MLWLIVVGFLVGFLTLLGVVDLFQRKHAVRRNFPIIGRLRYMLEKIGPELRQYVVTGNDEERPFTRDQRRWVYSAAKQQNSYFGFGTDNKMTSPDYPLVRHAAFPYAPRGGESGSGTDMATPELFEIPVAKVMGEWRDRKRAFRPRSIINISAMSYGSLSWRAVEAMNRGALRAGVLHNTGEGGVSVHHRHGAELVFQIGTGYFGVRDRDGRFCLDTLQALVEETNITAIEIKLSQGAKPGLGGVLPAEKVTPEIAAARGVEPRQTVVSPSYHTEFDSVPTMVAFVERIAEVTGVPVGIKSAVGQLGFWRELAEEMRVTGRGPDFIAIDGGEGGTGAAPLVFSDHVAMLFRDGFAEVYSAFAQQSMQERVLWVGSGKLGFPGEALTALSLGVDMIAAAREPMLAIGCIQAQRCHTGHCPAGIATQSKWLMRGLDPTDKAARLANYLVEFRHGLLQLSHACGVPHPSMVGGESISLLGGEGRSTTLWERYGYDPAWYAAGEARREETAKLMESA